MAEEREERIIAVADGDSFEVQVFQKEDKWRKTHGFPTVVADYTSNKILSVSPLAKDLGITRDQPLRGLRRNYPGLRIIRKPIKHGKPDSFLLRKAFYYVREAAVEYRIKLLKRGERTFGGKWKVEDIPICISGCDEFFMDLTKLVEIGYKEYKTVSWTHENIVFETAFAGYEGDILQHLFPTVPDNEQNTKFLFAAGLMADLQTYIWEKTGYMFSVGIGSNKIRAKIACNLNKPFRVTALPDLAFERISEFYKFRKVQGFGSELGEELEGIFGDLSISELKCRLDKCASCFLDIKFGEQRAVKMKSLVRGLSDEKVEEKLMSATMSCGRTGRFTKLSDFSDTVRHLTKEMSERIWEENVFNHREPLKVFFIVVGERYRKQLELDLGLMGLLMADYVDSKIWKVLLNSLAGESISSWFEQSEITEVAITVKKFKDTGNDGSMGTVSNIFEIFYGD